jgi:hypothetical protein
VARGSVRRIFWGVGLGVVVSVIAMAGCGKTHAVAEYRAPGQQVVRSYDVLLVPQLQAGTAGWCMTVVMPAKRSCGVPRSSDGPIFAEDCDGDRSSGFEVAVLTASWVPAVSIGGGPAVRTRSEPDMLNGLRAAFVETHFSGRGELGCPKAVPLNDDGTTMKARASPRGLLAFALPGVRRWQRPGRPVRGLCTITTRRVRGYSAHWGGVVTRVHPIHGLVGRALLSCADTEYFSREEESMDAAVLLAAAAPGGLPPELPGMKPLAGHHGIFEAPGFGGEIVARRIHEGWLVVEEGGIGGLGIHEATGLLEDLSAIVTSRL